MVLVVWCVICGSCGDDGGTAADSSDGGDVEADADSTSPDAGGGGDSSSPDGGEPGDAGAGDGGMVAEPMLPPECPDTDIEIVTADLGWTEGQEVRDALVALLATVNPGDTIVLSALYQLAPGGVDVPDGVRISAVAGAGFELLDIARAGSPWLRMGTCTQLDNVSILDTAARGAEEFVRTNNKTAVIATGEHLLFSRCLFEANTKTLLELRGTTDVRIHATHFDNGYFTLMIRPQTQDLVITESRFSNSFGDGIKTLGGGGQDVRGVVVRGSVFEDNLRDGIDTTAGFRASRIEDSIFRRNGVSGMDIKDVYNTEGDLHPEGSPNSDIMVVRSEFIDNPNGLVLTVNDIAQTLTEPSDIIHLVHNIRLEECIVERNEDSGRAFLIKDAHTVYWDGLQLLGDTSLHRIYAPDENRSFGGRLVRPPIPMSNYDIEGVNVTMGPARGANSDYPFDHVGPR